MTPFERWCRRKHLGFQTLPEGANCWYVRFRRQNKCAHLRWHIQQWAYDDTDHFRRRMARELWEMRKWLWAAIRMEKEFADV